MNFDKYFGELPYGFCSFDKVRDRLLPVRSRAQLPQNAQSIISILFPYYLGEELYQSSNISRYAVPEDYHRVAGDMLREFCSQLSADFPQNKFVPFIDSSPLPEVFCAISAGTGVMGKNGLLINKTYGSYCFIGEIVTDLPLEQSEALDTSCLDCGLCEELCPTGALKQGRVAYDKCLSAITQKKGELSDEEASLIRATGCIWGCDICQTSCPMNRDIKTTPIKRFFDTANAVLTETTDLSDRALAWRGRAVIDRNLELMKG